MCDEEERNVELASGTGEVMTRWDAFRSSVIGGLGRQ